MKRTFLTAAVLGGLLAGFSAPALADAVDPAKIPSMTKGNAIAKSLTSANHRNAGHKTSADEGRKVAVHRKKGNCLACHVIPGKEPFMGNIGPDLAGVGKRMTAAEMRLQIVDPKVNNPDTIMPGFYVKDLPGTHKKFKGKTMMSAQEIEDVIAYLLTLK